MMILNSIYRGHVECHRYNLLTPLLLVKLVLYMYMHILLANMGAVNLQHCMGNRFVPGQSLTLFYCSPNSTAIWYLATTMNAKGQGLR